MNDWSLFWSAIVGGIITGGFSILAVLCAHDKEIKRQKKQEDSLIKGLLQSIHDEVETLWDTYQEGMGVQLEALPENQPWIGFYPVTQDYFTVYHGNSFLIGKIKDNDLRKSIITTYTRAKGLIDSYRLNNDFSQRYEQLDSLFRQTNNPVFMQQLNAQRTVMIEYVKKIKESHNEVKNNVNSLLRELRKSGVLNEVKNS
jgi:hypothetical protein